MNTFLISNPKLTGEIRNNPVTLNFKLGNSNKMKSIRERNILKKYNQFFLKETVYFLYQKIFQRNIFNILLKSLPNWKDIQFEIFQKIFFCVTYSFYPMPQSYFINDLLIHDQEFVQVTTGETCWKIFSISFRNQLIRNHNISIRFTFLTLNPFTFSYPEKYIEENAKIFFLRINSTYKNQKLNGLIFKFFFSINLFHFALKNSFSLKSHLLDILIVNIINGKIRGEDNFYSKPLHALSSTLFDLDNYYLILKPLYFLQETEKLLGEGRDKLLYNYNLKLWRAIGLKKMPQKKLVCLKKKNFFKFLINLNGIDFFNLSGFKFYNLYFKWFEKRKSFWLKNIIRIKFKCTEMKMKILIGIAFLNTYSKGLFFEKNNFNLHKNKLFSKKPKSNCSDNNMRKFPTIFNKNLVKISVKKSFIFQLFFSCSNSYQRSGLIYTVPDFDNFFDNSDHQKFFFKNFRYKFGNKIGNFFGLDFRLLYDFSFSTQTETLKSGVINSFSYWDLSSCYILPIMKTENHEKIVKLNQPNITSGRTKAIKNNILKKNEKYLPWFFSNNLEFSMKLFHSLNKKINFYQLIKYIIKNFYNFMMTKGLGKNVDSNLKKFFRDIIHFRNSGLNKSLENNCYFKFLLNNLTNN